MARIGSSKPKNRFEKAAAAKAEQEAKSQQPVVEAEKEPVEVVSMPGIEADKEPVVEAEIVAETQPEAVIDEPVVEEAKEPEAQPEAVKEPFHTDVMSILRASKAANTIRIPITPRFAELFSKMGGSIEEIDAKILKHLITMIDNEFDAGTFKFTYSKPSDFNSSPDKRAQQPAIKNTKAFKDLFAKFKATNTEAFPSEHELFYDLIVKFMEFKVNA